VWDWFHLVRRPLTCLLYQPRTIDGECGVVSGMRIGRGNQSTQRKPAQVPRCPPQILHDLTWARTRAASVGSRRLTAWHDHAQILLSYLLIDSQEANDSVRPFNRYYVIQYLLFIRVHYVSQIASIPVCGVLQSCGIKFSKIISLSLIHHIIILWQVVHYLGYI
jgi:hypothetical protein